MMTAPTPVQSPKVPSVRAKRPRPVQRTAGWILAIAVVASSTAVIAIFVFSSLSTLWSSHARWWLFGRGLGMASQCTLAGVVLTGLWRRHPWRRTFGPVAQVGLLRVHATLASATIVLLAGHVCSLVADPYAHVSLSGAFVPFSAVYRPAAVALGTVGLWLIVLLTLSAALSGLVSKLPWLKLHQLALAAFVLAMAHGITTSSDVLAARLLAMVLSISVVVLLVTGGLSRHLSRPLAIR